MRTIYGLVVLLALGGCAGGGSISQVSSTIPQIDSRQSALVMVTTSVAGADGIAAALQQEIANQILAKRVFSHVRDTAPADVRIDCVVTEANDVTQATRIMVGALAGRAVVTANVRIIDPKGEIVLGELVVTGRSSGGNIFAGTTKEAVQETAKQITDYLLRNRQI